MTKQRPSTEPAPVLDQERAEALGQIADEFLAGKRAREAEQAEQEAAEARRQEAIATYKQVAKAALKVRAKEAPKFMEACDALGSQAADLYEARERHDAAIKALRKLGAEIPPELVWPRLLVQTRENIHRFDTVVATLQAVRGAV